MSAKYSRDSVLSSLFWKLLERGGTQGVQLVIQIILARLLTPEEFGTVALVLVFINLAQVFVQSGFSTALIQKKDADELDFSSVFYISIVIAIFFYSIMYISSPIIAEFYGNPDLKLIIQVLSLTLFPGALNSIQNAYISRNLLFKKLFKSSLGSSIVSGLLGIISAYVGFGIWALVVQQLSNQILISMVLWHTVKWRPKKKFSISRINQMFSYGSKLLVSGLIDSLYTEIRTLFIGRMYMPSILGYYNRGQQFPQLIVGNINGSIQSVMLPALSAHQDNRIRVKEMMRRSIITSSFLIFPLMIGLAVVAEPLILILLTDKWLPAVPFLQIFSISYSLIPIHTANLQAINAMGRSDIFLRLEIIKKTIGLIILGISIPFGIYAIAIGQVVSGIISSFINAYPNSQLLNYSYKEQVLDIMPSLLISLIMGGCVHIFSYLNIGTWEVLFVQIFVGIVLYTGLAKIFKLESFDYLIKTFKELKKKRGDVNA